MSKATDHSGLPVCFRIKKRRFRETIIRGLFDKVKKSSKENEVEKKETAAFGWDAITKECERVSLCPMRVSELYEKESDNKEISGYGMGFTLKLKKEKYEDEEAEIKCICKILQTIARITFTQGELFNAYEFIYTGQTQGIDTKMESNITGFITIPDRDFKTISTANGTVAFIEFIGATNEELLAVKEKEMDVKTLYDEIGSDITSYHRKSVR